MGGSDIIVTHNRKIQNNSKSEQLEEQLLKQMNGGDLAYFTITSLENSPGIIYETWKDGNALRVTLNKNIGVQYYIQPEQYKFLRQAKNCQEESYYGCIAKQLDKIGSNVP